MLVNLYKYPCCTVSCELCGGAGVPPPLAAHMRHAHPGCRAASARGYDRSGTYRRSDPPQDASAALCGQLAQGMYHLRLALSGVGLTRRILSLTIQNLQIIVGTAAGHCHPDTHLYTLANTDSSLPRACLSKEESAAHVVRGMRNSSVNSQHATKPLATHAQRAESVSKCGKGSLLSYSYHTTLLK